jgi:hypothetical protein
MDISTQQHWGQEVCIIWDTIPATKIGGITLVRDTVQGKTCYTLQLPQISWVNTPLTSEEWKQFLSAFLEEKVYSELSKLHTKTWFDSRAEFALFWKQYFPDGYDEKVFQWYLLELRSRYSNEIRHIETELNKSKAIAQAFYYDLLREYESRSGSISSWSRRQFWQDLALLLIGKLHSGVNSVTDISDIRPAAIVDEIRRIQQDPKYRQSVTQAALGGTFDLLKKGGIESGIMSVWGKNRADGAFIFRMPQWENRFPPYIVLGQWTPITAPSLQEWLDQYALRTLRPVFTQYLVDQHGEIKGEIRTHLGNWTKKILFPSNTILRDWIYRPDLIPKNTEIFLYSRNGGSGITLTKMTEQWWFLSMGINQESYQGLEAKSEYFTLWYVDNNGDLRGNIALSWSHVVFSDNDPQRKTSNTGASIVGNWEWVWWSMGN